MTFNIQTKDLVLQLKRIADALDRAVPFIDPVRVAELKLRGPEAIIRYGEDNKQWMRETYGNLIHERGLAPALEQELLDEMMSEADEGDIPPL